MLSNQIWSGILITNLSCYQTRSDQEVASSTLVLIFYWSSSSSSLQVGIDKRQRQQWELRQKIWQINRARVSDAVSFHSLLKGHSECWDCCSKLSFGFMQFVNSNLQSFICKWYLPQNGYIPIGWWPLHKTRQVNLSLNLWVQKSQTEVKIIITENSFLFIT